VNLEEVKQFLEANKDKDDVKTYLGELKQPNGADVEGFLDTEEGRKLLQPRLDQYHSKGLNSWKENNLQKLIDEEVAKRNPSETPEQKRIRELEEKIQQTERENQREKLLNKGVAHASEKGLPTDLVPYFLGEDEETTLNNLAALEEKYTAGIKNAVEEKFKQNGRSDFNNNGDKDNSTAAKIAQQANQQSQPATNTLWDK
jgi:hypothetical protein